MTPEEKLDLERKILRQANWLRILTAALAGLSLLLVTVLVWFTLLLQVGNRQILDTLTGAIETGNRRGPVVIKQLRDEHNDTQHKLDIICKRLEIRC